jgi:hypothetical protein
MQAAPTKGEVGAAHSGLFPTTPDGSSSLGLRQRRRRRNQPCRPATGGRCRRSCRSHGPEVRIVSRGHPAVGPDAHRGAARSTSCPFGVDPAEGDAGSAVARLTLAVPAIARRPGHETKSLPPREPHSVPAATRRAEAGDVPSAGKTQTGSRISKQ